MFTDATESPESGRGMPFTDPAEGGFTQRATVAISSSAGPCGAVFVGTEKAIVHSFIDRTVAEVVYGEVHNELLEQSDRDFFDGDVTEHTTRAVTLADSVLPADVEAGRRLFFSATDGRMSASGAGVSCSTCHLDARNDGLTWILGGVERQTPSLAGPVDATAPVTWSEGVASVADEAMLTSNNRMGGEGLSQSDADNIGAFVSWTRFPDAPSNLDAELVDLGKQVFNRADVGCASCHSGELYTDNAAHHIFDDGATQTPTLRGIAASGPYFHDGSALDLRAVLTMSRSGLMGDTSGLTDREFDALESYLKSL